MNEPISNKSTSSATRALICLLVRSYITPKNSSESVKGKFGKSCERVPKTVPILYASFFRSFDGSSPRTLAFPDVGKSMPVNILIVVDFPAPLGPINATRSPLLTENEISSTALISLVSGAKRFLTHPADGFLTGNENLFDKLETIMESEFMKIVWHKFSVF